MIAEILELVLASLIAVVILSVWFSDDWSE